MGLVLGAFAVAVLFGAPYLPVLQSEIDDILDLAELEPGQLILDLGCGDGRLLKAAAKRGIRGLGYEINPWLYAVSKINCAPYRKTVKIRFGDYWRCKLPKADAIYVFLIGHYMTRLDRKLANEIDRPTKLVSYVFTVPGRQPIKRNRNTAVYLYP